jgi:predicted nucleic acid-binding protein
VAAYLLDSSAAVKLYVAERGTRWLIHLASVAQGHELFIVRVTAVEIAAVLYRRVRARTLTAVQAATAMAALQHDLSSSYHIIEVSPTLGTEALRIAAQHGLRGYDCVQLAGATLAHTARISAGLSPLIMVSADLELNGAAQTEGLGVEDPNTHP